MNRHSLVPCEEIRRRHASPHSWVEGRDLEFKSSVEKLSSDLWETYSAFANTDGGLIVLGVDNSGNVTGISHAERQRRDLINTLNNPEKVSVNLCREADSITLMPLDGKTVMVINVPAAELKDKPVYLKGHIENCYLRVNEADIVCRREDIAQMMRDADIDAYTPEIVPYTSLDDVDGTTLKQYRNLMRSYSPQHPWVQMDDEKLLRRLSAYAEDPATGRRGLTWEGLLMFGNEEAITQHMPQLQLNYFEYENSEKTGSLNSWTDRICNDGTWTPNLYQFFFRVLPRAQQRLKNPFKLNADMTAQGESSAHIAVREALANAIVHADYRGEGGIIIRQFPHGLRFENPGTLLLPKDAVLQGGLSRCRNCGLQTMFMRIGIVEKAGSGIDRIMRGWAEQCMMPPTVEELRHPARIVWEMPFVGLLPKENEERIREYFGDKLYHSLESLQRIVLWIVSEQGLTGHKQIHQLLPYVHAADLSACLSHLVDKGCLSRAGRTTAALYSLVAEYKGQRWNADTAPTTTARTAPGASVEHSGALVTTEESSGHNGAGTLVTTEESSGHNGAGALVTYAWMKSLPYSLPEAVCRQIEILRSRQRISLEELDDVIKQICACEWVTLPQLSQMLDRAPGYLRKRSLQSLVRHGLLSMKYKEPTHPKQAYHTIPS